MAPSCCNITSFNSTVGHSMLFHVAPCCNISFHSTPCHSESPQIAQQCVGRQSQWRSFADWWSSKEHIAHQTTDNTKTPHFDVTSVRQQQRLPGRFTKEIPNTVSRSSPPGRHQKTAICRHYRSRIKSTRPAAITSHGMCMQFDYGQTANGTPNDGSRGDEDCLQTTF